MNAAVIHKSAGQRTFLLVFSAGDEVISELTAFCRSEAVETAAVAGIGAFSDAVVGWFDPGAKDYRRIAIDEQVEVLTLAGDIVLKDGAPQGHAHVVIGKDDGTAHGGHLLEAHVRPTLELVVTDAPRHLRKAADDRTGLALIVTDGETPPTRPEGPD